MARSRKCRIGDETPAAPRLPRVQGCIQIVPAKTWRAITWPTGPLLSTRARGSPGNGGTPGRGAVDGGRVLVADARPGALTEDAIGRPAWVRCSPMKRPGAIPRASLGPGLTLTRRPAYIALLKLFLLVLFVAIVILVVIILPVLLVLQIVRVLVGRVLARSPPILSLG
jgi:hypothetical protein